MRTALQNIVSPYYFQACKECELVYVNWFMPCLTFTALAQEKIQNLLYLTEGEMDFDSDKELPDIFAQVN